MAKLLLFPALLALLALAACSDPAPTALLEPMGKPQPEAAAATNQPEQTHSGDKTHKPTRVTTPRSTETRITAPDPVATGVPDPTPKPEPTATATPETVATAAPTPTYALTTTPRAAATSSPGPTTAQPSPVWRGIAVAPEDRCSPYDPDDYPYSPSVEPRIVEAQGGIYGPYTGTWFENIRETDIEHIVARSEAHDSGLCAASAATRSGSSHPTP